MYSVNKNNKQWLGKFIMELVQQKKLIIVSNDSLVHRYSNDSCIDAGSIYDELNKRLGCTYLIYIHEDLNKNEKFVYSSNWEWQNLLIGQKLINDCPIFLTAFNYLQNKSQGSIFVPWYMSPPTNHNERNVCGLRSEFNIGNGFGYGAKGNGIRETLAFGGDAKDSSFYKHFIENPNIFNSTLQKMRLNVLMNNKNHYLNMQDKSLTLIM